MICLLTRFNLSLLVAQVEAMGGNVMASASREQVLHTSEMHDSLYSPHWQALVTVQTMSHAAVQSSCAGATDH